MKIINKITLCLIFAGCIYMILGCSSEEIEEVKKSEGFRKTEKAVANTIKKLGEYVNDCNGSWVDITNERNTIDFDNNGNGYWHLEIHKPGGVYVYLKDFKWSQSGNEVTLNFHTWTIMKGRTSGIERKINERKVIYIENDSFLLNGHTYRRN